MLAALAAERERARGFSHLSPDSGPNCEHPHGLVPFLGWGWHPCESWGAWTGAPTASIELGPAWPGGDVALQAHVLEREGPVRVGWSIGKSDPAWRTLADDRFDVTIPAPPRAQRIVLHLPDTVSPADPRMSIDARPLGLGLEAIGLRCNP